MLHKENQVPRYLPPSERSASSIRQELLAHLPGNLVAGDLEAMSTVDSTFPAAPVSQGLMEVLSIQ